jgi:hypothetical protein
MKRFSLSLLVVFTPLLVWAGDSPGWENELTVNPNRGYINVYQSNDDSFWHVWAQRNVGGFIDTVRVSPDTSTIDGRLGYSEPNIMGVDSTLYCSMIVHKQVKGDSAYIMIRKSIDFGQTWETLAVIGDNQAIARHLRSELSNNVIHLIWEDCRYGYWRIYHEKIDFL